MEAFMALELPEAITIARQMHAEIKGTAIQKITVLGSPSYVCPSCQNL
jgi:hypothetical protein